MKWQALLAGIAVAEAAAIEKRQLELGLGLVQSLATAQRKPAIEPASASKQESKMFPQATNSKITWGPFNLQPANGKHANAGLKLDKQSDTIEVVLNGLCKDCMVQRVKADITDKNGNRFGLENQVYVHHIIVADQGRTMNMAPMTPSGGKCANGQSGSGGFSFGTIGGAGMGNKGGKAGGSSGGMGEHAHAGMKRQARPLVPSLFVAKGNEGDASIFSAVNNTVKSGYWINKTDPMIAIAEIVNYKNIPQDVYLTIDYDYISFESGRPKEWLDVAWGIMRVTNCEGFSLHPSKDKPTIYETPVYTSQSAGYLVGSNPHLHDGAVSMKIFVNDKLACESKPIYGQDGSASVNGEKWETITSYSPCLDPLQVKKGDTVQMKAEYDLKQHRLRPDSVDEHGEAEAMAIYFYNFAKSL